MPATQPAPDASVVERLALARDAFRAHYARCFWSWPRDTVVTPELLPNIAHALRLNGDRAALLLSEKICPSTLYRRRYSPASADAATPTAT